MKIINKNYGSIPHLSNSKMFQQADKKIEYGQEIILTQKKRDRNDKIIVTEKIDGSNVGVIKKDGIIHAITRSGYSAGSSQYLQHIYFYDYVKENYEMFYNAIPEGWRIAGEWCIMAHGTIYDIHGESPFVAFDIFDEKNKRITYEKMIDMCNTYKIQCVNILHEGDPISTGKAMSLLGDYGKYGICVDGDPEGVVYRCERNGVCDMLAKYVRSDKQDGKYLKSDSPIWNIGAERYMK